MGVTVSGPPLETDTVVEPFMLPSVALIVLVPPLMPVTTPELLTVATLVVADFQVTCDVRFCVPPP
jgi:hypothetical protein